MISVPGNKNSGEGKLLLETCLFNEQSDNKKEYIYIYKRRIGRGFLFHPRSP